VPQHRRRIGVVFQDYRLLPELNVWENIALPLSISGKAEGEIESRVTDLLNLISLADRALVFPKQLSGGEAQRASIARALAMGPSLIFADEPTGNLDKDSSLKIMKLFQQINELGTTVLLATHDVTLLDYLQKERQLALEKGKLAHDSQPKPLPEAGEEKAEETEEIELAEETEDTKEVKEVEAEAPTPAEKQEKPAKSKKKDQKKEEKEEKELAAEFTEADTQQSEPEPEKADKPSWLKNLAAKAQSLSVPKFGTKEVAEKTPEKPAKEKKDPKKDAKDE